MRARYLMLAAITGGTLFGTLGGLAIDTNMKSPPEPSWRHAVQSDVTSTDSYTFADSGPQDLSPTWYADRTPTWKRDRAYRPVAYVPVDRSVADDIADQPVTSDQADDLAAIDDGTAAARNDADTSQAALAPAVGPGASRPQAEPADGDPAAL